MIAIDASIAIGLLLEDGPAEVWQALVEDNGMVPPTFYVDIAQAILRAERRKRITSDQVMRVVETVKEVPLSLHVPSVSLTIALARKYSLSAYDATYLALAVETELELATLDERLAAAARSEKRLWTASRRRSGRAVSYLVERSRLTRA